MLNLYTSEIGKYYTAELTEDGTDIIKSYYSVEVKEREKQELDDLMYDYLLTLDNEAVCLTEEEIDTLENTGYDINPENYASIQCIYLSFVNFLYLPGGWII